MSWLFSPEVGDLVAARRDVRGGLLGRRVPAGRRGLVRAAHSTWLTGRRLEVEFDLGFGTTLCEVAERDVRLVARDAAGGTWRRRRAVSVTGRLIILALLAPALFPAVWYLLSGGDPTLLADELATQAVSAILSLIMPLVPLAMIASILWIVVRGGPRR